MRNLALIPALGLCACASTQSIMADAPDQTFTSAKSVNEVAFCIANKNNTQAQDGPREGKVVQVKSLVGVVGVLYEILPAEQGSVVTVRNANSPVSISRFKDCL